MGLLGDVEGSRGKICGFQKTARKTAGEGEHMRKERLGPAPLHPPSQSLRSPGRRLGLGTSDVKSTDTIRLPLMQSGGPGKWVTFADHTIIRQSWRTGRGKCEASGVKIRRRRKKKKTLTVLALKGIDQLHFDICKDITFKSHLSIWNQEDCGKRKPFQTNFISVHNRQ